jgi:hypothetical protein
MRCGNYVADIRRALHHYALEVTLLSNAGPQPPRRTQNGSTRRKKPRSGG